MKGGRAMNAAIIPTGAEILAGTVLDTSSPYIMQKLIKYFPDCQVTKLCPAADVQDVIIKKIDECVKSHPDLIIITGGSGGGHRYSSSLACDYTHSALSEYLDKYNASEIYGKNGHLWCRLVCGFKNECLVINLPGPYEEASAAFDAFLEAFDMNEIDIVKINNQMINAVYSKYPVREVL